MSQFQVKSIRNILEKQPVKVSAPCRLDLGGTWDLKAFALPYEWIKPSTVNIALNLRTHVSLVPYQDNKIKITNADYSYQFSLNDADLVGTNNLLSAVACHYGLTGYHAKISYNSPVKAGLGGSGVVAIAFAAALQTAINKSNGSSKKLDLKQIVYLTHSIEDSLNISFCGIQDQCAAAFGGVNCWTWHYSKSNKFSKKILIGEEQYKDLQDRLIVIYLGPHNSSELNGQNIHSFLDINQREKWFELNQKTKQFAQALKKQNWHKLIEILNWENDFRQSITTGRLLPIGQKLQKIAQENNSGFSVVGAGGGGCIWTISLTKVERDSLKKSFATIIDPKNILDFKIDPQGVIIN